MKRTYRTPKAVLVDFCFDEQVKAQSSDIAPYQDPPPKLDRCRQWYSTDCSVFWDTVVNAGVCVSMPYGLRPTV